jgi:hypothetical protein
MLRTILSGLGLFFIAGCSVHDSITTITPEPSQTPIKTTKPTISPTQTNTPTDIPTSTSTPIPTSTNTSTPVPTPALVWNIEEHNWFYFRYIVEIFYDEKFMNELPLDDSLIGHYFPDISIRYDTEDGSPRYVLCEDGSCPSLKEAGGLIPPWEWCTFVERHYREFGWTLVVDNRESILGETLQNNLGNQKIGAYCPNFDPYMIPIEATAIAPWPIPTPSLNWAEREYDFFLNVVNDILYDDHFREQFPCSEIGRGWAEDIDPFIQNYLPYLQSCPETKRRYCRIEKSPLLECRLEHYSQPSEELDPLEHPEMVPEWDWCTFLERTYLEYGFESDYVPKDQAERADYLQEYFMWEGIGNPNACSPRAIFTPCNYYCPNFDPSHKDMVRIYNPVVIFPTPTPFAGVDPVKFQSHKFERLFYDILFEIFEDQDLLAEALKDINNPGYTASIRSDPFMKQYLPSIHKVTRSSGEEIATYCPRNGCPKYYVDKFTPIPIDDICGFLERQYINYGWDSYDDRTIIHKRLISTLGNAKPNSNYPYCSNFDPNLKQDLDSNTPTPTRTPTPTPTPTQTSTPRPAQDPCVEDLLSWGCSILVFADEETISMLGGTVYYKGELQRPSSWAFLPDGKFIGLVVIDGKERKLSGKYEIASHVDKIIIILDTTLDGDLEPDLEYDKKSKRLTWKLPSGTYIYEFADARLF